MKIFALVLFAYAATRASGADTVGTHYDLSKAVALIAVKEEYGGADREVQYFAPLKTKFTAEGELSKLCKAIEGAEAVGAGQGPFVGHLCHFVVIDKDQEILGMVSILNFNSLCDIYRAHRDAEGRIVADYGKQAFGFTSRELARAFYDRLKKDDPAYMTKMAANYAKFGQTVEGLLFGNKPGEQAGADQPATSTESKPKGNEKPQPESKVAPR
jgi:hypothetical protein